MGAPRAILGRGATRARRPAQSGRGPADHGGVPMPSVPPLRVGPGARRPAGAGVRLPVLLLILGILVSGRRGLGPRRRPARELRAQLHPDARSPADAHRDARPGDRPARLHPDRRPALPRSVPRGPRERRPGRAHAPARGGRRPGAHGRDRRVGADRGDLAAGGRGDRLARRAAAGRARPTRPRRSAARRSWTASARRTHALSDARRRPPPPRARAQRGRPRRLDPAPRRGGDRHRLGPRRAPAPPRRRRAAPRAPLRRRAAASSPRRCR